MKSPLSGGWIPIFALLLIVVLVCADFAQSVPLRRRRFTSLSEQTLAAHHNRHKNSKSAHETDNSNSALVADGVFESEDSNHVPDGEDVAEILKRLERMI